MIVIHGYKEHDRWPKQPTLNSTRKPKSIDLQSSTSNNLRQIIDVRFDKQGRSNPEEVTQMGILDIILRQKGWTMNSI